MLTIVLRALKDKKILLLSYILGGVGMAWMYVALFPAIGKMSESYEQILSQFPEAFLEAFGIGAEGFAGFENYMSTEHFSFVWPIMLIFLIASFAGAALSREIERGTMEVMLSLPISRLKIFFGKYMAGIASLVVFVLASVLSIIPLAEAYHLEYAASRFYTMSLLGFLFGLAVFSISMLLSAFFSDRSRVYVIVGASMIGMYVVKIISVLNDNLDTLKYISFFYYFNAPQALSKNTISWETYAVFLSVAVISTIAGAWWFSKRDVAV